MLRDLLFVPSLPSVLIIQLYSVILTVFVESEEEVLFFENFDLSSIKTPANIPQFEKIAHAIQI